MLFLARSCALATWSCSGAKATTFPSRARLRSQKRLQEPRLFVQMEMVTQMGRSPNKQLQERVGGIVSFEIFVACNESAAWWAGDRFTRILVGFSHKVILTTAHVGKLFARSAGLPAAFHCSNASSREVSPAAAYLAFPSGILCLVNMYIGAAAELQLRFNKLCLPPISVCLRFGCFVGSH